jgi:hypothetical protein
MLIIKLLLFVRVTGRLFPSVDAVMIKIKINLKYLASKSHPIKLGNKVCKIEKKTACLFFFWTFSYIALCLEVSISGITR